ncbi:SMI1/KNR4 family protein [Streptomyces sp. NPDC058545]|uniref:SMI1/KNR4 family protein n=1 Tax=Streptomyces sp. NPDC058545 TaxID=3346544 RepID=UPI00365A6683
MSYVDRYKRALALGAPKGFDRLEVKGMSPDEILMVERDQGVLLPCAYRDFLEVCGNSRGGVLDSEDIYYRDLIGIKDAAYEILQDGGDQISLDDYVVFVMHQGYIFYCVKVGSPDPPVFGYSSMESGGLVPQEILLSEFIGKILAEGL